MPAKQFSVKSHKFKADQVIISELEETQNGKPVIRLKYNYGGDVGIGPLTIQMDPKVAKMGISGMLGEKPSPITTGQTADSISLSFSENENFTAKEKSFIQEIDKTEKMIIEKVAKYAHQIFDGIDENEDPVLLKRLVEAKFKPSIQYSTEKDANGKKTKKRDHKYTSMRVKMYKNLENGVWAYQGKFIPYEQKTPIQITIDNQEEIIPKWSEIQPMISGNAVWIVPANGFGIRWTPNLVKITRLSEGYTENEFEADSDNEEEVPKIEALELKEESSEAGSIESEEDLDDLEIKEPPKVVKPEPKTRRTTAKK